MEPPSVNLPRDLVLAARTHDCVPFLGAGISRPSGMSGWAGIVDDVRGHLSERLGYAIGDGELDFLQVPQMYSDLLASSRPLEDLLDDAFLIGFEPNAYHHALAQLPADTFVTTNWDVLLEKALVASPFRAPVEVLYRDDHISHWSEAQKTNVIKLHGTITDHRSIVFTENQYLDRYAGDSLLFQLVRVLLASRSVLMVGFSYSDAFVKLLFHQVARFVKESRKPQWFVTSEDRVTPAFLEYIKQAGFMPVVLPSSAANPESVLQFLEALARETSTVARDRSSRARLLMRISEPLLSYRGSERVLRIRANLGPFGSPEPDPTDHVFGSSARDEEEYAVHRICVELVEKADFRVRLLGGPVSLQGLMGKGYSHDQALRRIEAFATTVARLGDRFEFAQTPSPSDRNQWIAANRSVVESWKEVSGPRQLYSAGLLREERAAVIVAARLFDDDFQQACERGGGLEAARARLIRELEDELRGS